MNFPFIYINIPKAPACIYLSQLIRYSRACGYYKDFLDGGLLLKGKVLNQGYLLVKFKSSLRKDYGRLTWLTATEYLCHKWPHICSTSRSFPHSWLITRFATRVIRRVPLVDDELPTLSEHMSSTPGFNGVRVAWSLVLCVVYCSSLSLLFLPMSCLSFELPLPITPLAS